MKTTIIWVMFGALPLLAQDATLIDFSIEDQLGATHSHRDYQGQVLVVLGSDQEGSQFNPLWVMAINDSLGSHPGFGEISFMGVADVSGVPFFIKPVVKRMFPSEEEKWVLLDWDGLFTGAYEFKPDSSNILVFDRRGRLVLREQGREVHVNTLRSILTVLTGLLDQD